MDNILIFDLDGTLLDSMIGILFSVECVLKKNAPEYVPFLNESIIGPPIKKILEGFISNPEVVTMLSKEFRFHYDSYGFIKTKLFEGVYTGLKNIKKSSLYVSTNKPKIVTSKILSALDIEVFFNEIISIDSSTYLNKTEIVARIKSNNISKKIIVIGDSSDDYYSAKDNNCDFIFCSYGYGNLEDFRIKSVNSSTELFSLLSILLPQKENII